MVKELYEKEVIEGSRVRELLAEFNKKEDKNEKNGDNN
jgi:cell division protease FtsH